MSNPPKPLRVRAQEEVQQQTIGALFMAKSLSSEGLPMPRAARQASDGHVARERDPRSLVR